MEFAFQGRLLAVLLGFELCLEHRELSPRHAAKGRVICAYSAWYYVGVANVWAVPTWTNLRQTFHIPSTTETIAERG